MTAAFLDDGPMTAAFLDDLVGAPLPGQDLFVLADPFRYRSGTGRVLTVPPGFQTDFASVPRLLRAIVDPTKLESAWAAVVHDYLYQEGPAVPYRIEATGETGRGFSRAEADDVFHEALRLLGIDPFDAWTMWAGVRAAGWAPWRRYRERQGT